MANMRMMTTITFVIVVLLSLFTTTFANPTEGDTGRIICQPALSPHLCQLRLTMYDEMSWEVNNNWYNVIMHVYDPWCRQLSGNVWANLGGKSSVPCYSIVLLNQKIEHVSVTSELPWTIEVQVPTHAWFFNDIVNLDPPAMYADLKILASTNFVDWWPSQGYPWGGMSSSLFGFPC